MKMNFFSFFTRCTGLIIFLLFSTKIFSQSLYPTKVESPNAASLGKFGEIPVNLFTGTPDISIPIHTLSYGRITVPITLRYNNALVKPGQQPGWVGSGWDLESVGSISRQVRGAQDEFYISSSSGNETYPNSGMYFPFPGQTVTPGSELANASNWDTQSQLVYNFTYHSEVIGGIDVEADEFSFNVMGYSGKFYYSGAAKGWQVVSDHKIKVEMTDFYTPHEIIEAIKKYDIQSINTSLLNQSRSFGAFILTMPDGTKFYFGGKDGSIPDAVEFSSPRTTIHENKAPVFTANTWMLKKVEDVNNNVVTFSYKRTYPTCNLYIGMYQINSTCVQNNISPAITWGGGYGIPLNAVSNYSNVDTSKRFGIYQWPMYLISIQSPNEAVNFITSNAAFSRYTNDQLKYADVSNKVTPDIDNTVLGINLTPDERLSKIQWAQLDKIVVTDRMHNSIGGNNYNPNVIRQFKFNYSTAVDQRLTLNTFELLDNQNAIVGKYSFEYNFVDGGDLRTTSILPLYADGNYTDHWGYFNNQNIAHALSGDIYSRKQPSSTAVLAGLLNKITYPTGGYTTFNWQSNDYSRLVSIVRTAPYVISNGIGGGNRIFEIKSYLSDGTQASAKTYYYKKDFTTGVNASSLTSSGVLNGKPQYEFSLGSRIGVLGNSISNMMVTYFNGTTNFSYTGQGSPVGYDEVIEVNADGSYTKNFFTNYDVDLNGVSHWDKPPAGYLGWDPINDTYFPRASLERERGKVTGVFIYSSSNILLQKTVYAYRNDANRFNEYVKLIDLNGSYGGAECSDALVLATARPVYTYNYYPVSKTITTYDQYGNNPIVQATTYDNYNANNLLKAKTEINSKGQSIVTNYKYPTDYSDPTSNAMVAAHILSPVIETSTTNNAVPVNITRTPYYSPSGTYVTPAIYVPQSLQVQIGGNPIVIKEIVTKYDSKGNVLEIQKSNGIKEVYIWGCNSQYIMAKIIGSDYATASGLVNQSMLDQAGVGYNNYSDADIRAELNKLRTGLPNAIVTTYTYKSSVGIATETDPNGRTTFYVYDAFARLSAILDKDQNVLKKFCYNYAGQPENCETVTFTNSLRQATFTSQTCPSGTIPATYTYTVPEGKYSSYLDKATAEQMALDDLNTNGQAAANALSCLAAFSGLNKTDQPWVVSITNADGTFNNTYSFYPSSSASVLANLPLGNYNISLVPMYPGTVTSPVQLILNGTTYSGTNFSFPATGINSATAITLQPTPSSGPCSFTMSSGFSSPTNSISNNGSTASFYIVFYSTSSMQPGFSYKVATINGACRPSTMRTIPYSSGGRNWTITIYPNGEMYWQLSYSSTSLPANTTVTTNTLTYNL